MREKDKICHYKALEKLSTQELDRLLQEELRKETPDEKVVLPVLQALRERETEHPVEISKNAEDAWNTYRDRISGSVPATPARKRYWILNTAAVAAIACVLIMALPNTVGAESIFDVLFRWTESVFEFLAPGENSNPSVEYVFETDNPGLQQLYDKVVEMGITEPVVPMWLPEGYELVELKTTNLRDGSKVYARFQNIENSIIFIYRHPTEKLTIQYEKNTENIEVFESHKVSYFIFMNDESTSVTWINSNVEGLVSLDLEVDEIYRIIKSIYKEISF